MRLIHDIQEFNTPRRPKAAERWTAIIPAAGRGSRLNSRGPKILYPVLGKPILRWLTDLLRPLCQHLVFVLSPQGVSEVQLPPEAVAVIQKEPTGMADAIALCEKMVTTPYTLVIWGDQITPHPASLAACMTLLESEPTIQATLPTLQREQPYIHFERDTQERIVKVFQARESDTSLAQGESDCGVFCFRTKVLFQILKRTRGDSAHQGAKTHENNFLSLLPLFQNDQGDLLSVRLHDPDEALGINTVDDAKKVGEILKRRERKA